VKIKGIPINLQEMRKAIKATIKLHKKALKEKKSYENYPSCPLCAYAIFNSEQNGENRSCKYCPWLIFKGYECKEEEYLDDKKSIHRLIRWLKKLEEYDET
jgi:hypothetical protein